MTATTTPSTSHVLLIPTYNTGARLVQTVREALAQWRPVWVVVDGSTDGSAEPVKALAQTEPGLRVLELPVNQGKGAAVLHGMERAQAEGYTHAMTMDADGQHPADLIGSFMRASIAAPDCVVLGKPVFDASAPLIRVCGRQLSNGWANLETLGAGIGDSLFGFRVYPIAASVRIMQATRWMRRFDFDPELAVRLCWAGVRPLNLDAPVKYFSREEGGVSHFNYLRDNTLLTGMHLRLMLGFLWRLPLLVWRRWSR